MCNQDFKPLLPRQRLAAGKAQIEMDANEALRRVASGLSTVADAQLLQRALTFFRGKAPC